MENEMNETTETTEKRTVEQLDMEKQLKIERFKNDISMMFIKGYIQKVDFLQGIIFVLVLITALTGIISYYAGTGQLQEYFSKEEKPKDSKLRPFVCRADWVRDSIIDIAKEKPDTIQITVTPWNYWAEGIKDGKRVGKLHFAPPMPALPGLEDE
jgi:hypothetical protein